MLSGIHPILTGLLLAHLDEMGHSDGVVIADAHFPAARVARRLVILPALDAPTVLAAIRTVIPLDDDPGLDLMQSARVAVEPVQVELLSAAGLPQERARFLDRYSFYEAAQSAFLVIRTGEARSYGNVLLRKGLVM